MKGRFSSTPYLINSYATPFSDPTWTTQATLRCPGTWLESHRTRMDDFPMGDVLAMFDTGHSSDFTYWCILRQWGNDL